MSETRYCYGIIILVLLVLISIPVMAQPITAPAVISAPGVYEITGDNRGVVDVYGIKIESSDVVLDGNSFIIGGDDRENSIGVYVNKYGGSITNVTIKNLKLEGWESAISYQYVKGKEGDNNEIINCEITDCPTAIHIEYSDFVKVEDNKIRECSTGVNVEQDSSRISLNKNEIKGSGLGISLQNTGGVTLNENTVNVGTGYGVQITDSSDLNIVKNNISDNKYAALFIEKSQNSSITGNNFSKTEIGPVLKVGNEVRGANIYNNYLASQIDVSVDNISSNLVWNSTLKPGLNILGGPYLGGNYWGAAPGSKGFSDDDPDEDGYGIGDNPYVINIYNTDYLPLVLTNKTAPAPVPEPKIVTVTSGPVNTSGSVTNVSGNTSLQSINATKEQKSLENGSEKVKTPAISVQNEYSMINISAETNLGEPADTVSVTSILSESVTNESVNSTEPGNGYLMFTGLIPGETVVLVTYTQSEVKLDSVQTSSLTIPVPSAYSLYSSWKVTSNNMTISSGNISKYPASDETIVIDIKRISTNPETADATQNISVINPSQTTTTYTDLYQTNQTTYPMNLNQNVSASQTQFSTTSYNDSTAPVTYTDTVNGSIAQQPTTYTDLYQANETTYPMNLNQNVSAPQTQFSTTSYNNSTVPVTYTDTVNGSIAQQPTTYTDLYQANETTYPMNLNQNVSAPQTQFSTTSYNNSTTLVTYTETVNGSVEQQPTTYTDLYKANETTYPMNLNQNVSATQTQFSTTSYNDPTTPVTYKDTVNGSGVQETKNTNINQTAETFYYPNNQSVNLNITSYGNNTTPYLVVPTPAPYQPAFDYNRSDNQSGPLVLINGINGSYQEGYTITAYSGPGGVIFPEGSVTVIKGENVTFIITPRDGHKVGYLLIDGLNTTVSEEYRFENVTSDHTIIAGFT